MSALPAALDPLWLVADSLARVATLRSALADGRELDARSLDALERDLLDLRARLEEARA